jgi:peptidoglycan hydrolase CwlO-like protein
MSEVQWNEKGTTLSDKSARKEFGLSQEIIIEAAKSGKLQYRVNFSHGNQYLRLVRAEVESLAKELHGKAHFEKQKIQNEMSNVQKEINQLKKQIKKLEERRSVLADMLGA